MGGLKRKIPTDKKIEKKESKSVAFSKRRKGLYSKTAQLCLVSGAQVAILATPVCPKSNVSFYSFGHSSVDSVVSAFLANKRPREDLGSAFWWEDEGLAKSNDLNELTEAVDSISRTLQNLKGLRSAAMANREDMKKKEVFGHGTHQALDRNQTLNLQSTSASICFHEDPPENYQGLAKNSKEEDQIVAISDNNNNNKDVVIQGTHQELGRNQTLDCQSSSASLCIQDVSPENLEGFVNNSEQKDQIVSSSDSNNNAYGLPGNLDGFNQEVDLDQFIDLETNFEDFITTNLEMDDVSTNRYSCSDTEGAEDGAMVIHSNSHKDNLHHFSELNEDQIVAISDNNNALPGHLYGCNQEVTTDQIFDMVMNSEGLSRNSEWIDVSMMNTSQNKNWCSNYEAVKGGSVVFHRDLDQDNLQFSEFFSMS